MNTIKRWLPALIILLLAAFLMSRAPATAHAAPPTSFELVSNSNFDTDADANNRPDIWKVKNFAPADGLDCAEAHTGCSVNLTASTKSKTMTWKGDLLANPDVPLTFHMWTRTDNLSVNGFDVMLKVNYFDGSSQKWTLLPDEGTHAWQETSVTVTPLKAVRKVEITLKFGSGSGEAWIDDVGLTAANPLDGWTPPATAAEWRDNPVRGTVIEIGYGGPDEYDDPPYPTVDSLRLLKELGVHVVNLEFQYAWTIEPPYEAAEDQYDLLEAALDNLSEVGLYAIVSVRNGPGRNAMMPGIADEDVINTLWTDPAAHSAYNDMLTDMVTRFSARPEIIAWEPIVEPALDFYMFDGEEAPYPQAAAVWNPIAADFIETVRAADPNRPIIIEPVNWGGYGAFETFVKFDDENVIYSLHQYEPFDYSHQEKARYRYPGKIAGEFIDKDALEAMLAPVDQFQADHDVTIIVGEWGGFRWQPGMAQYIADQRSLFEERGWSWMHYAWYDAEWPDEFGLELQLGTSKKTAIYNPRNPVFAPVVEGWQTAP
jgi:hypothetical protein